MSDRVRHIGSRLELLVDDFLVDELRGGARQALQHPQPREIILTHDRAWEGNICAYHTFFRDGERVRVYYRGSQLNERIGGKQLEHQEVTCMAESCDGIHWRKPVLERVEFQGSRANNIVFAGLGTHNFAPFKDNNPDCAAGQRYKGLGGVKDATGDGPLAFASADGIHWSRVDEKPVMTDGAFDSQNLAFWDTARGEYRAYYRDIKDGVRDIKTATSTDFIHWSAGQWLQYPGASVEQLYTNQVSPYFRAPHIFIGFPSRIREDRGNITEGLLMSSRDGITFQRWGEALIRPGLNRDRWGNRSNYIWHGLIETPSDLPGGPNELSLYAGEHFFEGNFCSIRRFTLRMDGFVSINAPLAGGELVTRLLTFDGDRLVLNVSTAAAGNIRVELQDAEGSPLPGFALKDCDEIWGDTIERTVSWKNNTNVSALKNQPMRLRFVLNDADLYSFRFGFDL